MIRILRHLVVVLSIVFLYAPPTHSALTLNKQCYEVICDSHSYCSEIDKACRPCTDICSFSSNNHDAKRCETGCQDYLHDQLYSRHNASVESEIDKIESELLTLKILLGITITMSSIVMLLTIFVLCHIYLKRKIFKSSKGKSKVSSALPAVIFNKKFEKNISGARLDNGMNNNDDGSTNRTTISNSSIGRFRREPSESTLPEYYDNPTLSPSPTNHV